MSGGGEALASAEYAAAQLADPVIDALKLEGSVVIGHPACNSDYPTNPQCKYPRYPAHSLPFGPAPFLGGESEWLGMGVLVGSKLTRDLGGACELKVPCCQKGAFRSPLL